MANQPTAQEIALRGKQQDALRFCSEITKEIHTLTSAIQQEVKTLTGLPDHEAVSVADSIVRLGGDDYHGLMGSSRNASYEASLENGLRQTMSDEQVRTLRTSCAAKIRTIINKLAQSFPPQS